MSVDYFLDTNVLLYAYDLDAEPKREIAMDLLTRAWEAPERFAISVQVLQEFAVNFLRNRKFAEELPNLVEDFCHWNVIENTLSVFRLGLELKSPWKLSLWDAMILAAARMSGARELITEDLNDGQDFDGIRVVNPFR